jgi:hypothetical protein
MDLSNSEDHISIVVEIMLIAITLQTSMTAKPLMKLHFCLLSQ